MCDLIGTGYPGELRTENVWNELVKLQEGPRACTGTIYGTGLGAGRTADREYTT
jgi:hypothetical protein